jgi:hypothetical protein
VDRAADRVEQFVSVEARRSIAGAAVLSGFPITSQRPIPAASNSLLRQ